MTCVVDERKFKNSIGARRVNRHNNFVDVK
jgi:hypothetical protein